jgi:tetratricopeptide (TPR) repeat protein
LTGETSAALAFARQQKHHGEELPAVAFLEAVRGDQAAGQRSLEQYARVHSRISPRFIELQRFSQEVAAAIIRGDGRAALDVLSHYPDFQNVDVLFSRALAHLLVNDYSSAEQALRATLIQSRAFSNFGFMQTQVPLFPLLSHYYLGRTYEATGKNQQAIDEYQSFLSHFEGSRSQMPQVAEARAALKRLIH